MNRGEKMVEEKKEDEVVETVEENEEAVETEVVEDSKELFEQKIAKLEEEVNTWKTDYYKVFADMENSKRRLEKEHSNSMKFMMQSFIEELSDVSVISASFKTGDESKGSISVIGPTRMPYEKVVSLVDYISKSIEQVLLKELDDE